MKKKWIWATAALSLLIGIAVPTAVILTKNSKTSHSDSNSNNSVNDIDFSKINSKKLLESLLQNTNNSLNEFLVNQGLTNDINSIIDSNATIVGVDEMGNIIIDINCTLSTNEQLNFSGSTSVKSVIIDEKKFLDYINSLSDEQQFLLQNIDSTIGSSMSLFLGTIDNVISNNVLNEECLLTNASSAINAGTYIENGISFFKYNFNIVLNDQYVFLGENNSISSEKNILDVKSHVICPIEINFDKLKEVILKNSTTIESFNKLLDVEFLKDLLCDESNQIINPPSGVISVSNPQYSINSINGDIILDFEITTSDNKTINISCPVSLKAIICNDEILRKYYEFNVNNISMINNKETIYNSGALNINDSLNNILSSQKPSYIINNNLPILSFDITMTADSGFVFCEDGKTISGTTHTINDVITNIVYSGNDIIVPNGPNKNDSAISDAIGNITKPNDANSVIENPGDIINKLPDDILNLIDLDSTTASLSDVNSDGYSDGKLHIIINYVFTNGTSLEVNYATKIMIVKFNNDTIISAIKNDVNNEQMLDNLNTILINSQSLENFSPFAKLSSDSLWQSTGRLLINDYVNNDNVNKDCYKIELEVNLSESGYCFYDSSSKFASTYKNFGQYLSSIIKPYDVTFNDINLYNIINEYVKSNFKESSWSNEDTKNNIISKINSILANIDSDLSIIDSTISLNNVNSKGEISFEINTPSYINLISNSENISILNNVITITNIDFMKNNYLFRESDFYNSMSIVSNQYTNEQWNSSLNSTLISIANKYIANSNILINNITNISCTNPLLGELTFTYEISNPNESFSVINESEFVAVDFSNKTITVTNLPLKKAIKIVDFMSIYDLVNDFSLNTSDENWNSEYAALNQELKNNLNNILLDTSITIKSINLDVDSNGTRFVTILVENPNMVELVDNSGAGSLVTFSNNTFKIISLDK